jgi:hypothetical protein
MEPTTKKSFTPKFGQNHRLRSLRHMDIFNSRHAERGQQTPPVPEPADEYYKLIVEIFQINLWHIKVVLHSICH